MEKIKDMKQVYFEKTQGGEFRWITISTVLLALGAILHMVAPSFGGVTPNFLIATYVIAILLLKPSAKEAFGIGLVAGLIEMMTSKSNFPYGNLISETAGAMMAYLLAKYIGHIRFGKLDIMPAVAGFLATMVSGIAFVYMLVLLNFVPFQVATFVIMPIVIISAIVNLVLAMLLYYPAYGFMLHKGIISKDEIRETDHSKLIFEQQLEGKITAESLTYTYPRGKEPALQNINLAVKDGEFLMVTGPSGCGKTTLAMSFVGAIPHFFGGKMQGMVFVEGEAITQTRIPELAMKVGTVLADFDTQIVTMTVGEEVAFAMENRGFKREEMQARMKEVLDRVGLAGLENRKVTDLSGGQRQRLAIAATLVTDPDILVLDEPTSALDPEATKALYEMLGHINRVDKMTIVVIENALESALPYLDRIALLDKGELITVGSVADTLDYMYDHKIYTEALPNLYHCKRRLGEKGFNFTKDFTNVAEATQILKAMTQKEA